MAKMGLAAIYQAPRTTVPHPEHRIYKYLLRDMVVERPNQVWYADITSIPMRRGFLYLVAVMDWATRKVLSWRLSNTMEADHAERAVLMALVGGGKQSVRKIKRAQVLLAADGGLGDEAIVQAVGTSGSTVYRTKRRFVIEGLDAALEEEPRPGAERKLSGKEEALLVATACSKPPAGCVRWTLELLAGEFIKLTEHESLSRETVRRRLAENQMKPWRKNMWCIPKIDAEYVARMEDVLDLYAETPEPHRPVICFDESPTQLIGEVRPVIPAKPGQLERYDCEYRRNGTANLFVFLDAIAPGAG